MTRLALARKILEQTKVIQAALQAHADDQLPALFENRQELITDYLILEEQGTDQESPEAEIQAVMREGYKLNQQVTLQLQQKRQQLLQEMQQGGQIKEASNAYASPYETVYEPMFFDKKK